MVGMDIRRMRYPSWAQRDWGRHGTPFVDKAKPAPVGQSIIFIPHAISRHPRFAPKVMHKPALRHGFHLRQAQSPERHLECLAGRGR